MAIIIGNSVWEFRKKVPVRKVPVTKRPQILSNLLKLWYILQKVPGTSFPNFPNFPILSTNFSSFCRIPPTFKTSLFLLYRYVSLL